jgi:hypothetical protein
MGPIEDWAKDHLFELFVPFIASSPLVTRTLLAIAVGIWIYRLRPWKRVNTRRRKALRVAVASLVAGVCFCVYPAAYEALVPVTARFQYEPVLSLSIFDIHDLKPEPIQVGPCRYDPLHCLLLHYQLREDHLEFSVRGLWGGDFISDGDIAGFSSPYVSGWTYRLSLKRPTKADAAVLGDFWLEQQQSAIDVAQRWPSTTVELAILESDRHRVRLGVRVQESREDEAIRPGFGFDY